MRARMRAAMIAWKPVRFPPRSDAAGSFHDFADPMKPTLEAITISDSIRVRPQSPVYIVIEGRRKMWTAHALSAKNWRIAACLRRRTESL